MSEIKLFRFSGDSSLELVPRLAQMERNLQYLVEKHLSCFLGIRFLAHEYRAGRLQRGSIDTLGIDENNCPVIIEYKRYNNENIITQGLYYLNWLLDHQGDFVRLAERVLGDGLQGSVEFGSSRVLCIASDFSRYDEDAVLQIDRNVELIRYRFFGQDMLMLEMLNTSLGIFTRDLLPHDGCGAGEESVGMPPALQERVRNMQPEVESLYLDLLNFTENLGEDVRVKFLKHYVAVSRLKNFTCIQPARNQLKLWLPLDPGSIILEPGFSRDVTQIGHHASGNLELEVKDRDSMLKAQPLIELAYQQS